jgi:hypothetical protein
MAQFCVGLRPLHACAYEHPVPSLRSDDFASSYSSGGVCPGCPTGGWRRRHFVALGVEPEASMPLRPVRRDVPGAHRILSGLAFTLAAVAGYIGLHWPVPDQRPIGTLT